MNSLPLIYFTNLLFLDSINYEQYLKIELLMLNFEFLLNSIANQMHLL